MHQAASVWFIGLRRRFCKLLDHPGIKPVIPNSLHTACLRRNREYCIVGSEIRSCDSSGMFPYVARHVVAWTFHWWWWVCLGGLPFLSMQSSAGRVRASRLMLPLAMEVMACLPFCRASPRVPCLLRRIRLGGTFRLFTYSFPYIPSAGRGRARRTLLPLVVEIMELSGPQPTDPNGPFFLWSKPSSLSFVTKDPPGGTSCLFDTLLAHFVR